tara:strand:- start:287 stop:1174 length:888 start_codon:yes stop_codon:yes gene_type:complete
MRNTFAQTLTSLAEEDERLVLLIGDISHHLLRDFQSRFPNRFYNAGICEQSIVSMAAGLAAEGLKPVVHTIAPFCVERAFEQIKIDLCYQNLDVSIVSVGSSFDYAHLGCTHHCYEDVSILRSLPNIDIFVPGRSSEFVDIFKSTWGNGHPKYFKLSKDEHDIVTHSLPYEFEVLNKGEKDTAIFVNGHLLEEIYKIPDIQKYTIVYSPTIEPHSCSAKQLALSIMQSHNKIVTVEENSSIGAFGDKITDIAFSNNLPILNKKVGIPRKFCDKYGKAEDHRKDLGLTASEIEKIL